MMMKVLGVFACGLLAGKWSQFNRLCENEKECRLERSERPVNALIIKIPRLRFARNEEYMLFS